MARPTKQGLSYFPLDVDADYDDKFQLIETIHGPTGFAVIIKLMMKIYNEGFFYNWSDKEQILFARRVNVEINQVKTIISDCITYDLFDKTLYDTENILTSRGIQSRFFKAVDKRKKLEVPIEYLLIDKEDIPGTAIKYVLLHKTPSSAEQNTTECEINQGLSTQIKVKESKEKESKAEESKEQIIDEQKPATTAYRFWESNVAITGLSQFDIELLNKLLDLGGNELTVHAMKKAIELNRRRMKTVDTVLRGWLDHGVRTTEEADIHETNWIGGKTDGGDEKQQEQPTISDKYNFGTTSSNGEALPF
ncbi:Lin1244/Lin1753 domain-containing protein [Listeria rustica]|uniref:DUF4373 domain-containing protein n=1 Tax=Listeria rustica TaxID=2713503 RepID=A0A7W1T6W9_9LIST|nr:DUF4373 domain-containing protein [Listeria rustica]